MEQAKGWLHQGSVGEDITFIWSQLDQALQEEAASRKYFHFDLTDATEHELVCARDRVSQVLRFLKIWYDFPADTVIVAIHLMDAFLAVVKAQVKHVPCIALGCFHISIRQNHGNRNISLEDLISLSQVQCTVQDLLRMENIVTKKLKLVNVPSTCLTFLRIFHSLLRHAMQIASVPSGIPGVMLSLDRYIRQLEIIMCNHNSASFQGSLLALALLSRDINLNNGHLWNWEACIKDLQTYCKITPAATYITQDAIQQLLRRYECRQHPSASFQRNFSWRASPCNLRQRRLPLLWQQCRLPTLTEHHCCPLPQECQSSCGSNLCTYCSGNKEDGQDVGPNHEAKDTSLQWSVCTLSEHKICACDGSGHLPSPQTCLVHAC